VIGKNVGWKQTVNMGKKNNQAFVFLPHARFVELLSYKAELVSIQVVLTEESYTSKASFLDGVPLPVYGAADGPTSTNTPAPVFSGKRSSEACIVRQMDVISTRISMAPTPSCARRFPTLSRRFWRRIWLR